MAYYTPTEVLNDIDKTFGVVKAETPINNKLTVSINGVDNKKHYIGSIVLTGTTGTGGNTALVIKMGSTVVWTETFTVGTDKVRQFQAVPLVGNKGEAVTVEVSANDLAAGKLYVVYYTK